MLKNNAGWLMTVMIILIINGGLLAQDTLRYRAPKQKSNFFERVDLGGYLGAQFGTITMIDVSPMASVRVTEKFHPGIGLTYQYYKDKRYVPAYSSSAYGASIFARYFIWRDLFAHVEYAPLYVNYYDYFDNGAGGYNLVKNSTWVHDLMIGGGYRQWVGGRSFVSISVLWNVNETYYSPYRNPIIRIGFGVGL